MRFSMPGMPMRTIAATTLVEDRSYLLQTVRAQRIVVIAPAVNIVLSVVHHETVDIYEAVNHFHTHSDFFCQQRDVCVVLVEASIEDPDLFIRSPIFLVLEVILSEKSENQRFIDVLR
jgi:hypothetical protein